MRAILDAWEWLLDTRLAAVADGIALFLTLPWAICLTLDADLLEKLAPLTALGTRMPQVFWAMVAAAAVTAEVHGLLMRALDIKGHRKVRLWASLGQAFFLGWIGGELLAQDVGVPGAWYFPAFAALCVVGAARLQRLTEQQGEESSRF